MNNILQILSAMFMNNPHNNDFQPAYFANSFQFT